MNPHPFSLDTEFRPEDAGEDKIDLELYGWEVHGLDPHFERVHAFKQFVSSPPLGCSEKAWPSKGELPQYGWFFKRPEMIGKDNNKLLIRKQALVDKATDRRHEAPLCGGYCLFYRDKKPDPESKKSVHRAKLTLALNLQRFIRHQPREDDPQLPHKMHLQRYRETRSSHGEEFAFDEQDNWIPNTPTWNVYAARDHFRAYANLISKQLGSDLQRACDFLNAIDSEQLTLTRVNKGYRLSAVETLWEFPSENPIADVLQIGTKLLHLKRGGTAAKIKPLVFKEAKRLLNSPCFTVPLAESLNLRVYAKTNQRIRFEVVHVGVGKRLSNVLAQYPPTAEECWAAAAGPVEGLFCSSSDDLPLVLNALRRRAADHMNQLMTELRKGRKMDVKACSVVKLLAEVAVAVPAGLPLKPQRLSKIQTILFLLCYQRGFRGKAGQGPYAGAWESLHKAGVLEFDRKRQFYILAEPYIRAADALISVTGDPLLDVFGINWGSYRVQKGGGMPVRLRE